MSTQDPRWQQHWQQRWYPVAYLEDLDRRRPQAFTLLGDDLVLWWDGAADQWRAFADVCPHRLVPLSEGRLNDRGELECPYHGWSFAGDGHCSTIPQASTDQQATACGSPRAHCRSYATAVGQGLLFVFAGDPASSAAVELPLVPPLQEPGWLVQGTFRDLPMDALTVLENVLDVSHVPFTHHRTVGRRDNASPVEVELTSFGPEGFTATWPQGPRRGRLGSQYTTFCGPCLVVHDLTAKGFGRILTVVYATPIRPGECRLFARFPFQFSSPLPRLLVGLRPRWLQHLGNHLVLEDDQIFLHWQERVVADRGGSEQFEQACYLPTGADRYVSQLHRWVRTLAGTPFPHQPLPSRLSRQALLERWNAHTRHCRACSGALRGIRRWRVLVIVVLACTVVLISLPLPLLPLKLVLVLLLIASGLLLRQLHRWEQLLLQGEGHPPRNRLA
ncbi:MAG: Rieske 2Fe-2S domain-containing protein [Cyanobacteria bacterium K_DeepCast_35m_m2_023]|nr:Rieske 2Fe-2S domain-containing protein [Cyanobacteria bacterium K_DeepCast_35m_m2_023]